MKQYLRLLSLSTAMCAALAAGAATPYITQVFEYRPAPGQFINTSPSYSAGDTEADMCRKALEAIGGTAGGTVSLGAFGGYITFGFDHTVANEPGQADFTVLGNSFFNPKTEKPDGGSSEPGVIMVSRDDNGNGLPDDTWYEIRGEAHASATAGYTITYTRPAADHKPEVSDPRGAFSDDRYIAWKAGDGESGYLRKLVLYTQPYYPEWIADGSLIFTGTRLAGNAFREGSRIKEWVLYPVGRGYADCYPNDDARAGIDISLAVDANGNPANLSGIDFVRVHTGQNQDLAELGETSTEITGAVDLHLSAGMSEAGCDAEVRVFIADGELRALGLAEGTAVHVHDLSGRVVFAASASRAVWSTPCALPRGTYIIRAGGRTFKTAI